MRRMVLALAVMLAAPALAAAAQGGAQDKTRRIKPDEAAAQARAARARPGQTVPPVQARQPVTPAADYYPYDRRTGGM